MARHSHSVTETTVTSFNPDTLKTSSRSTRVSTISHSDSYDTRIKGSFLTSFFGSIVLMLLLVNMISALQGDSENIFTFTRFFEYLGTSPNINLVSLKIGTITGDWGIFDFFRSFLNTNISILNFFVFFAGSAIQLLLFVLWFVGFVFSF